MLMTRPLSLAHNSGDSTCMYLASTTKSASYCSTSASSCASASTRVDGLHRYLEVGHRVTLRQIRAITVIAHYRHNVENEVALITAIEEVGETVIESRNHEQRPAAHCFGSNAQIWSKAVQLLSERTFHYCHVVILGFKTSAHAELGGHGIGELVVLQYVAAQLDNGRTGGEHDARTIDALQSNYRRTARGLFSFKTS